MDYAKYSDVELLSLVIGTREAHKLYQGRLIPLLWQNERQNTALKKLGAAHELVRRSLAEELKRTCVLNRPEQVKDYLRASVGGLEYETFVVLFLDSQHRLIASEELFRGTLNSASVYPREVVKAALRHNAAALIFAHNHPSGIAEPSEADRHLTERLRQALVTVDVRTLDHMVVGGARVTSFAERGWL